MKFTVNVKPNSRKEGVEARADGSLTVRVNAPPIEGRANIRVIELLSEYFDCPKSRIRLISGSSGKRKIFEVDGT